MKEHNVQNLLRIFMSAIGIVNWRNNTGNGWVGKTQHINKKCIVACEPGDVVIRNARPLKAGLCKGSSDVIGITPLFITHQDVGRTVGIFTAVEVKTDTGRPSKEQLVFLTAVEKCGGYAGIARTRDDVKVITRTQ